jgi:HlyD family secretion protein
VNRRLALAASAAAVLVTVACLAFWGRSGGQGGEVPLYTVKRSDFIRQVTAEGVLESEKATPISVSPQIDQPVKIGWIADDFTPVKAGDVVVQFDPTDFESALDLGQTDLTRTENKQVKASTTSTATRRNLERDRDQAELELEAAQNFSVRDAEIFSRYELIQSDIDEGLALGRKQYATDVMGIRSQLSAAERELISIEQRKADQKIGNARKALQSLVMTAPHDGILVLKRDWRGDLPRVGATIFRGFTIGEIPDLDEMKAEVFALEADAGGIAVDQKARIWLESDPSTIYGATVSRVDKMAKPRQRGVPVQYFGVTLKLDQSGTANMKPGARVRATIELAREDNAVTIPRQALFEEKGEKFVWIARGKKFERRIVETGATSAGRIVVTSGLEEGDSIALAPPPGVEEKKEPSR